MKQGPKGTKLVTLGRRELLIGGASLAGLVACGPGGSGLSGGTGTTAEGGACPSSVQTADAPSAFVTGQPVYYPDSNLFVVRDSGGLYALSAICTHAGCVISAGSNEFVCPCHRSVFDLNGNVTAGPAPTPLQHFALCMLSNGKVGVDSNTFVSADTRLNK